MSCTYTYRIHKDVKKVKLVSVNIIVGVIPVTFKIFVIYYCITYHRLASK